MTPVSSIQLHPLGHADVRRRQEHRGRLLVQAGNACARYQDKHLKNLQCKRVQCDEIWAFCYSKDKNVPSDKLGKFGFGSVWTWVAIDADTTLICSMVGNRDAQAAFAFIEDLASRIESRIQLTTDGHAPYLLAVDGAFGADVDYAMLVNIYGETAEAEKRYSPAECIGAQKMQITGSPDPKHISTRLRRAPEPHDADAHAPFHPANQWLQQEA